MKEKETKQTYLAPAIEVIQVENEGIMASSVDPLPNQPWGRMADAGNDTQNEIHNLFSRNA